MKYPSIKSMIKGHKDGMQKVHEFLKENGADHWHDKYRFGRSGLTIRVNHLNNYIECGPCYEDPDDVMYYVWTQEDYEFRVPTKKISDMWSALKSHQSIRPNRIAPNITIKTDVTNQFSMHERVDFSDYSCEYVVFRIEFRIYHYKPPED